MRAFLLKRTAASFFVESCRLLELIASCCSCQVFAYGKFSECLIQNAEASISGLYGSFSPDVKQLMRCIIGEKRQFIKALFRYEIH